MASAMRVDADDEAEDQFEMPLEDLSDPVQSVEPPQTTYHAVAGRERERKKCGIAIVDGRKAYAACRWLPARYRTRSRTCSLGRGGPRPSGNEPRGRKTSAMSESEAADGERTAKSAARSRERSTEIIVQNCTI